MMRNQGKNKGAPFSTSNTSAKRHRKFLHELMAIHLIDYYDKSHYFSLKSEISCQISLNAKRLKWNLLYIHRTKMTGNDTRHTDETERLFKNVQQP